MAGFRVIELPGHAPGQIGLFRESDRLALVSDCFYTLDIQTGIKGAPRVPHPAFNADTEQARASIRKLAALEPSIAWPGHADPVSRRRRRRSSSAPPRDPSDAGVGRRSRQREKLTAPVSDYHDPEGNVLRLRGSLSPASRRQYADTLAGGLEREDAWQRAIELLFERLAASWTIAGLEITRQQELLGRYRMASAEERRFVRDSLREHVGEHFPELQAP